jgi:hypothetical protein
MGLFKTMKDRLEPNAAGAASADENHDEGSPGAQLLPVGMRASARQRFKISNLNMREDGRLGELLRSDEMLLFRS